MKQMRLPLMWMFLLAMLFVTGCWGGKNYGTVPAEGIVTLGGEPLPGAVIAFSAAAGGGSQFSEYTDENGRFSMKMSKSVKGIPPGEYKVTVRSMADLNPGGRGIAPPAKSQSAPGKVPKTLPEKYLSFENSGLAASVQPKRDNFFTFALEAE